MNESKERKIGAILSYVSIIFSTLIQLLYTPFLIRMLGQSEYGIYSLSSSIIGYLTVLDLGFGNAIIVYTSKYKQTKDSNSEKKLHGMFLVIYSIISIVTIILGIILYYNVEYIFSKNMNNLEISKMKTMMLILTFNLAISFPFSVYSAIINAYEKFVFQKVMSILNTMLKPLIMIPLLFLGYKSIAMAIIMTIVNIIVMISNYIYCKEKLKINIRFYGFDKKILKEIIGYSFFIFLGVVVDKINWSADQFILGIECGTVSVSIYSVASQINTLFINLSTAISGILLPKVSKMVAGNVSNEELSNEFIKIGRIQFIIIFLFITGLIIFGKQFFVIWAGENYTESYYIALILTIPLIFPLIQNLGVSILQAKNLHKFRSILYAMVAIVNILISIPLAKMYSGIGAAIGTAISLIIGNIIIINIYYYKKAHLDILRFWKEILKMIIPYLIPIIIFIYFVHYININGIKTLILFGLIYVIIYIIISYYFVMNEYEKNIFIVFFKKRVGKKHVEDK